MSWTAIATLKVNQNWQFTPEIAPHLGYVRLTFFTAGVPVWIAQADLDSGDLSDERRIWATSYAQIFEFHAPSVFQKRAIALRLPNLASFEVRIEVSDVPVVGDSDGENDLQPLIVGQSQILQELRTIDVSIDPQIAVNIDAIVQSQSAILQELTSIDVAPDPAITEGIQEIIQRLNQPITAQIDPAIPAAIAQLQTQQTKILQFIGRGRFNVLNYSLLNNGDYAYFDSTSTMLALRDGNLSAGMIANASRVFVQVQFASAVYLNRVQFYPGQFNGGFNMPRSFRLYAGRVTTPNVTPLFESSVPSSNPVFDLAQIEALDTPATEVTFEFFNSTHSNISVLELQLFGQIA